VIETLEQIDRQLFLWLNGLHTQHLDGAMYYISKIFVFAPLFIWWFYEAYKTFHFKKLFAMVAMLLLLVTLTDQSSNRVKHIVKRYRPTHNTEIKQQVHTVYGYEGGKFTFFSGHAANTFGLATYLFLMFRNHKKSLRWSFIAWALLTSYSRIYLGVHYPSDIFTGMCVGIFWGWVVYKLSGWLFTKYRIPDAAE
jgi:undecaprenyl-diphosphatase